MGGRDPVDEVVRQLLRDHPGPTEPWLNPSRVEYWSPKTDHICPMCRHPVGLHTLNAASIAREAREVVPDGPRIARCVWTFVVVCNSCAKRCGTAEG